VIVEEDLLPRDTAGNETVWWTFEGGQAQINELKYRRKGKCKRLCHVEEGVRNDRGELLFLGGVERYVSRAQVRKGNKPERKEETFECCQEFLHVFDYSKLNSGFWKSALNKDFKY